MNDVPTFFAAWTVVLLSIPTFQGAAVAQAQQGQCLAKCPRDADATCEDFSTALGEDWLVIHGEPESGPPFCGLRLDCSPGGKSEIQSMGEMLYGRLVFSRAFHSAWAEAPEEEIDSFFGWQIFRGDCHTAIVVDDGTIGLLFQDPPECRGDPPPNQQCFCAIPDWPDLAREPHTYDLEWSRSKVRLTIRDGAQVLETLVVPSEQCPCPADFRVPDVPMKVDVNCNLDGRLAGEHVLEVDTIAASDCVAGTERLCLNDGRFEVKSRWRTPDGRTGPGTGVQLTGDTGYFWFFSESNVEAVVKVLDGCAINDHFWFFAGGLTNVEVEVEVTDSMTGDVTSYVNPLGGAFQPIQDTAAFMTCPPVGGPWRTSFKVDAKPANSRTNVLQPTIQVRTGDRLAFEASGSWSIGLGQVGANGGPGFCAGCPVQTAPGALIGRIGNGAHFFIGEDSVIRAPASGTLFLGSNDNAEGLCDGQNTGSCYNDNTGSLSIRLTVRR
jgi:hypothetical protein